MGPPQELQMQQKEGWINAHEGRVGGNFDPLDENNNFTLGVESQTDSSC
jgi:hypothetical protein